MAKIIELTRYRKNKCCNMNKKFSTSNPISFSELNEGIKQLSLKNLQVIIQNLKEQIGKGYKKRYTTSHYTQKIDLIDSHFIDLINWKEPFSIPHEIGFIRGYHLDGISENDWKNITDIIIRMSIITGYDLWEQEVQPYHFVDQYTWTSIETKILHES